MVEFALKDKVVLVTGSSSGIGEAVARFADAAGAKVVVNSSSSVADGEAVANSLKSALYLQGDITSAADAKRLVEETVRHFGALDVLINNAGRTKVIAHHDLDAATTSVFREIFEVNVFGTWEMTMAAMDALKAAQGAIVNVTSIAGIRPTGSSIPYAASKAALNHLTVLLAKVAGPEVTVNAVAPGLVDTPWTESWVDLKNAVSHIAPMRRTATPQDVAKAVLDVATSRYITGQVIVVDGGLTIAT
jgi:ketoreductase RED2